MSDPHQPHPAQRPHEANGGPLGAPDGNRPDWNKDIKAYYDSIAAEPIPDEIQQLMAILAKAVRK